MKKIVLLAIAAAVTFIAVNLGTRPAAADDSAMLKVPDKEIVIEGKKPARFDHQKHLALGVTCGVCHHDADHKPLTEEAILAMDSAKKLECQSCHNQDFANEKLNSVKLAFHARCKECHKQGVGDKKGPTKCTDCHLKKKK